MRARYSRRRYIQLAAATVTLTVTAMVLVLLAIDLYLHRKYQNTAALNIWGYRGPTVGRKAPGEMRVVVLGGSTAFGYGPNWDGAFPYLLEQRLNRSGNGRYSVVNLAYNNEGAYSLRYTLEDYSYLDYDIAILYEGYNDLGPGPRYQVFRRESAIFRLTGYLPIFPMVFREKAYMMLRGGDIRGWYGGEKTVFRPGLATATTAKAIATAAETATSLERQLGRLTTDPATAFKVTPAEDCPEYHRHYCGSMYDAITWARHHGTGVLVGTQPFLSDLHVEQQTAFVSFVQRHFGNDQYVRHVNLGRAIDLAKSGGIAYDGVHLTAEGNDLIAANFVQPVLEMTDLLKQQKKP